MPMPLETPPTPLPRRAGSRATSTADPTRSTGPDLIDVDQYTHKTAALHFAISHDRAWSRPSWTLGAVGWPTASTLTTVNVVIGHVCASIGQRRCRCPWKRRRHHYPVGPDPEQRRRPTPRARQGPISSTLTSTRTKQPPCTSRFRTIVPGLGHRGRWAPWGGLRHRR